MPVSSMRYLDGVRLLSICTSTAKSSVYASRINAFGQLTAGAMVFQDHGRESASMIFRLIDNALASASLDDFDLLTFDRGPGAFTGVRIGCGVAQGLGFGKSIPVVGVNALASRAMQMFESNAHFFRIGQIRQGLCAIAIDARMGEVYCAVYRFAPVQAMGQSIVMMPTVCNAEHAVELFENVRRNHLSETMFVGGNVFVDAQSGGAEVLHQSLLRWASVTTSSNVLVDQSVELDAENVARFAVATIENQLGLCSSRDACLSTLNQMYPASLAAPEYIRNNVALDKTQQAQLRMERNR
jgi:tRNA threonylcarbamoyl adenosine modification protein YeaZ